jgi:AraC family transcriptional regulator, transcriptional activator FtrA
MKPLSEILKSVLSVRRNRWLLLIVPLGLAIVGCVPSQPAPQPFTGMLPASPKLDLRKPTVAVVLGNDLTEITDVIAPYVAFKTAAEFNVVLVGEQRQPVTLSGGLEVIPHFSFAQLDKLLGRDPDLIIVPNVPNIEANEALRLWVQKHGRGKSQVMSVCAGAAMFAATELIDGQTATTHWGDLLRIEPTYPKVRWMRGQRYVDNGQFVSTAGILSGIDGSLHMIARMRGKDLAQRVAKELHYPTQYLEHPEMPQYSFGFMDAVFLLKSMGPSVRPEMGVALFDGVDEMRLSALYDVYTPWLARRLEGIGPEQVIITKHGMQLIAKRRPENWDATKEILLPGTAGNPQQPAWLQAFRVTPTQAREDEFAFAAALKTLARTVDLPTAEYAAKRIEYRWFQP